MKRYFLIAVLALGVVSNPIIGNEFTSSTKIKQKKKKKDKHVSSTITALGMIASVLLKQIGNKQYPDRKQQISNGTSCLALVALATAIGYDIWKLRRNIISSAFRQTITAVISKAVTEYALSLVA